MKRDMKLEGKEDNFLLGKISNMLKVLANFCYKMGLEYTIHISRPSTTEKGGIHVVHASKLDIDLMNESIMRIEKLKLFSIEKSRFLELLHIRNFRVYLVNDRNLPKPKRGMKQLELNKPYLVHNYLENQESGYLALILKDPETGKIIEPPKPYKGYNSKRFITEDYTLLN